MVTTSLTGRCVATTSMLDNSNVLRALAKEKASQIQEKERFVNKNVGWTRSTQRRVPSLGMPS